MTGWDPDKIRIKYHKRVEIWIIRVFFHLTRILKLFNIWTCYLQFLLISLYDTDSTGPANAFTDSLRIERKETYGSSIASAISVSVFVMGHNRWHRHSSSTIRVIRVVIHSKNRSTLTNSKFCVDNCAFYPQQNDLSATRASALARACVCVCVEERGSSLTPKQYDRLCQLR